VALAVGASAGMAALIVAMSIANVFINYIPSTFLGAPEEGTELSVLPAHRLLLEGRGYQAIKLTTIGCLGGLIISAALALPFMTVIALAYELIRPQMHLVLASIVVTMILLERSWKKIIWSSAIFLASGLLGLLTLDTNLLPADAALMPLLSGLFGISILLPSLASCGSLPEQHFDEDPISLRSSAKSLCAGTIAGSLTGIIPSIGPSQGTVMAQLATGSNGTEEFLVAVSSVNTSKAIFSFIAIFAIGKARSGAAIAVGEILGGGNIGPLLIIGVVLLAGGIAAIAQLKLGKLAARHMGRFPYRGMCTAVLVFMIALTVYCSGLTGILVLATATALGLLPAAANVKRTHSMGVITLPCILFFAGAKDLVLGSLGL